MPLLSPPQVFFATHESDTYFPGFQTQNSSENWLSSHHPYVKPLNKHYQISSSTKLPYLFFKISINPPKLHKFAFCDIGEPIFIFLYSQVIRSSCRKWVKFNISHEIRTVIEKFLQHMNQPDLIADVIT